MAAQQNFLCAVLEQQRTDLVNVTPVRTNWEEAGFCFTADKSQGIRSEHRLAHSLTDTSIFWQNLGHFPYWYLYRNYSDKKADRESSAWLWLRWLDALVEIPPWWCSWGSPWEGREGWRNTRRCEGFWSVQGCRSQMTTEPARPTPHTPEAQVPH